MLEKISEIILEYVEFEDKITEDMSLKSDLGMTSFDMVCLCSDLEEAFGINITSADMRANNTVGKLMSFIEEKTASGKNPVTT